MIFISCKPTPEELAKNSCDCFQKVKDIQNTDKKAEELQECFGTYQSNRNELREIEKDEDMSDEQVQKFEARFDTVYNKCQ